MMNFRKAITTSALYARNGSIVPIVIGKNSRKKDSILQTFNRWTLFVSISVLIVERRLGFGAGRAMNLGARAA